MKLVTICLLAVAGVASAQPRIVNSYLATCTLTLSANSKACTIQQPASGARDTQLVSAYIYSTVALTVTQERNGTAASATAVTPTALNPEQVAAATAAVYEASNVGSGTVLGGSAATIAIPATSGVTLELEDIQLRGNGTTKNYTIRTSSATGTVTIILKFRQF